MISGFNYSVFLFSSTYIGRIYLLGQFKLLFNLSLYVTYLSGLGNMRPFYGFGV